MRKFDRLRHIALVLLVPVGGVIAAACGSDEYRVGAGGSGGNSGTSTTTSTSVTTSAGGNCGSACCVPADCDEPMQVCLERTCVVGQCGLTATEPGTASPWQIQGDCKGFVCGTEGGATEVVDELDVLDDHNACTSDTCGSTGPTNTPLAAGTPCTQNGGSRCDVQAHCVECLTDLDCGPELCLAAHCVPPTCGNSVQDAGETGTDCGGPCGATCDPGEGCVTAADCVHGVCTGGICAAPACDDDVKNGDESDIDCGGSCSSKCGAFHGCTVNADCAGDQCSGVLCIPNCHDGERNNAETDVDCGGPSCTDCGVGDDCQIAADCESGACTDGRCCDRGGCEKPQVLGVTTGWNHSCALISGGRVKCWGYNADGELGLGDVSNRGDNPGDMGANLPFVAFGGGIVAVSVAAGRTNSCAILSDGRIKCWGSGFGNTGVVTFGDSPGEMGNNLPFVDLGTGRSATAIAIGYAHLCALLDGGDVKCWGENFHGELGLGDVATRGDDPNELGDNLPIVQLGVGRHAIGVAAGYAHTCALLDDGSVKCWGWGGSGLGSSSDTLGDGPSEMGDALPTVPLGLGKAAVAISAGSVHTCALLDDGGVKCWGWNNFGQLGIGDTDMRGAGPADMGDALPEIQLGSDRTAVAISSRQNHTCALLDNGTVKCWGENQFGSLGLGDTDSRGDALGEMGDALPSVPLGVGRTAKSISVGFTSVCVLLDTHSVKCWGDNSAGQLGLGDTLARGDDPNELGEALPAAEILARQ